MNTTPIRTISKQTVICRGYRALLILTAIGLLVLLSVAAILTPSGCRHGTHEQLGLPPCMFYISFGQPCPACGMTTAWANLVRGNIVCAFRTNAGGALLGIVALAAVPWLCISTWYGRWVGWKPNDVQFAWIAMLFVGITLTDWLLRLWAR